MDIDGFCDSDKNSLPSQLSRPWNHGSSNFDNNNIHPNLTSSSNELGVSNDDHTNASCSDDDEDEQRYFTQEKDDVLSTYSEDFGKKL